MSVFTNSSSSTPEEVRQYVDAIIGLIGDRTPMEILAETPGRIRALVDDLNQSEVTRPEAPGKWSIRHVLQHLVDSELVWGNRLRMVIAHDRPTIIGYDQDLWADRLDYNDVNAALALSDFTTLREMNLRLLRRVPREALKRVGVHSERGEESVELMLKLYSGHDEMHINQIERIRETVRN